MSVAVTVAWTSGTSTRQYSPTWPTASEYSVGTRNSASSHSSFPAWSIVSIVITISYAVPQSTHSSRTSASRVPSPRTRERALDIPVSHGQSEGLLHRSRIHLLCESDRHVGTHIDVGRAICRVHDGNLERASVQLCVVQVSQRHLSCSAVIQ